MTPSLLERLQEFGFDKICGERGKFPDLPIVSIKNHPSKKTGYELYAFNGIGLIVANGKTIADLFSVIAIHDAVSKSAKTYWKGATIPEDTAVQTDELVRDLEGFTRVQEWSSRHDIFWKYSFNELGLMISEAGLLYNPSHSYHRPPRELSAVA